MSLLRPEDVATELGISRAQVVQRAKTLQWPHSKVGKQYRFSADDLAEIQRLCHVKPSETATPADTWGVVTRSTRG